MGEPVDLQQCEHCDKELPIETMSMMEDCWFCESCVKEWREEFDACKHEWRPYVDQMGDEGRICDHCNGFAVNKNPAADLARELGSELEIRK